jgi:hypothetical protein
MGLWLLFVPSCGPPVFPQGQTHGRLMGVHAGIELAIRLGHLSEETLAGHGRRPNSLNAYLLKVIEENHCLDMDRVREAGLLEPLGPDGAPVFVDYWGRPIVCHVPAVYPEGLTYTTSKGEARILPLPESVWPSGMGPVQVWSLGENGLDERGKGDDIVASMGGDFSPPASR